jgi:hypothetical protein
MYEHHVRLLLVSPCLPIPSFTPDDAAWYLQASDEDIPSYHLLFLWLGASRVELDFMGAYTSQRFWRSMWHVPLVIAALYLGGIYFGQRAMAHRKPFDLRGALAYWNLFLALFSLIGALRTVPYALYFLWQTSFHFVTCQPPAVTHGERDVGLWVVLFLLSKMLELFDTAFIVLRKKPLMFLHCESVTQRHVTRVERRLSREGP